MMIRIADMETIERCARFFMGMVALLAVALWLTFKFGMVSPMQTYERQSWYLVSEYDGFVVTRDAVDEVTCRKRENAAAVCRSGTNLLELPIGAGI